MRYFISLLVGVACLWSSASASARAQCTHPPLDEETLHKLTTNLAGEGLDLQPGQTFSFKLFAAEGCHSFQPVEPCVSWSVGPVVLNFDGWRSGLGES